MYLDEKLNFLQHIKEKTLKSIRGIGVIQKLRHILLRYSVITIYKSFVRPHFNYCDIIYDGHCDISYYQPNNESFWNRIEKV